MARTGDTTGVRQASQAAFDTEVVRLFDQSLDLFCVAGFDGYLKLVNPAFERALGYTKEQLLARPFLDITHPDDVDSARQALAHLSTGEDLIGFVTRLVCADGSIRWVEWNTSTRPDESFVYGVGRDITDRRRADAELSALRRVATLVAEGAQPSDLFAVVAEEVGRVVAVPLVSVVRYESDGTVTECASYSPDGPVFDVGSRWSLEGTNVPRLVRDSSQPARIDDHSQLEGEIAERVRRAGIKSTVGIPIVVAGRLWGAIVVSGTDRDPLPERTDASLADFTELLATAIANAESRETLKRLADEQAALRRVATLVAVAVAPSEIFSAVSREISRRFGVHGQSLDVATVVRFDPGPEYVLVGMAQPIEGLPLGSRWGPRDLYVSTRVCRSGRSARVDERELTPGEPESDALRRQGIVSQVGSPIVVDDRLWGAVTVNSARPLPPDTEERLEKFTDLVATAIANAESREARAMLIDEHSALRRVATLAAAGAPRMHVFAAVAEEVGRLLGVDHAYVTRLDDQHSVTVLAGWISTGEPVPVAFPLRLPTGPITDRLRGAHGPVRLDPYPGDPRAGAIEDNLRSVVAAPITVDGKLWGFVSAASAAEQPPPPSTEARLSSFTELLASAIADAESRESVGRLADEQAALRRVATLVAQGVAPAEIFAAVSDEVGRLFDTPRAAVDRFEADGSAIVVVGAREGMEKIFPTGSRWEMDELFASTRVFKTGRAARVELANAPSASGPIAELLRRFDVVSTVASPIVVGARLWGAITVSTIDQPLPHDTEDRLGKFTELVATAIANAQSAEALEQLADEQAGLRRMATLVAQGVPPVEIFSAVSDEVGRLFGTEVAAAVRFEHDPPAIVFVGVSKRIVDRLPTGTRWELDDTLASAEVYRTGRPARIDARDWSSIAGPVSETGRRLGVVSTVATPIIVEGRLWGAMTVSASDVLASDVETRLEKFTELVATAIANAEGRSQLAASRRRIVAASDQARRTIERDLHDGMQQRLVSLALTLRAAERRVPVDDAVRADVSRVATGLTEAVEELQELSRGIHPAILSQGGLASALRTLARRATIPVELDVTDDTALPEQVEIAAYFVVSEGLANAFKHARASRVKVSLTRRDGVLLLSVRDDGIGGADAGRGTGLIGLTDRIEALGGTLAIHSRPGSGTQIAVELPVESLAGPAEPS